jgi:5-(carboxyamino)imidazole ribonucleotide synthase
MGEAVRHPVFTEAAAMVNLLGDALPSRMPEGPIRTLIQTYGKGIRRGRKLGHITLIGPVATSIRAEAKALIAELHDT